MAERRLSSFDHVSVLDHPVQLWTAAPASAWFVRDADGAVLHPFYIALDEERRPCWTDDRRRAHRFESKQAAERFAIDRVTAKVCVVPVA